MKEESMAVAVDVTMVVCVLVGEAITVETLVSICTAVVSSMLLSLVSVAVAVAVDVTIVVCVVVGEAITVETLVIMCTVVVSSMSLPLVFVDWEIVRILVSVDWALFRVLVRVIVVGGRYRVRAGYSL